MNDSLIEKVKALGLRVDLATTAPQQLESDEFIVFSKLEGLIIDKDGGLVPKLKIAVGGISEDPKKATDASLYNLEQLFDSQTLQLILQKGFGYDVASSQPFYQKSEQFLVVGKLEVFDYTEAGKPRTVSKVSTNIFNDSALEAQKEALKSVIDTTKKLQ